MATIVTAMPLIDLANSPLKAIVDDCDVKVVRRHKWHIQKKSSGVMYAISGQYASGTPRQTTIRMHRLIMGAKLGQQIDHINHNGLDNTRANLRFAGKYGNSRNKRKLHGQTSVFKGVHRNGKYWRASIRVRGKLINIGTFSKEALAAAAYNHFARVYFQEFACLNPTPEKLEPCAIALVTNPKRLHRAHSAKWGSRFVGVLRQASKSTPWIAKITTNKKCITLGAFTTEEAAAKAYNDAARKYHGARAKQNILPT